MAYVLTPAAAQRQAHASKRWAWIFSLERQDGVVLRATSHDRFLTVDGESYSPMLLAEWSQERHETGLKESEMEATALVGEVLTVEDLQAGRYRGAVVRIRVVDWQYPWLRHYSAVRFVRRSTFGRVRVVLQLESRAALLQQTGGGRFGGTTTPHCVYELGDPTTCKKDIAEWTKAGVTVQAVSESNPGPSFECDFTIGSWPGTFDDDFYRDGSITWTTGDNAGVVSPIIYYGHASRRCTFLLPTPFPIQVGDVGTAKVGCDGLLSTCIEKFGNVVNFGGSPYDPGAAATVPPSDDEGSG